MYGSPLQAWNASCLRELLQEVCRQNGPRLRRGLSEMDPRSALKGGSANGASYGTRLPCGLPFLVRGQCLAGWGLFLACFSVLGLDWGFWGLGRSLGKALENWLGGHVSDSGLILGCFLESGYEHARTGPWPGLVAWSSVESSGECEVVSKTDSANKGTPQIKGRFPLELSRARLL